MVLPLSNCAERGQVLVAGSVFLDVVMAGLAHAPRPGEEQWVSDCSIVPGGSANQAIALARLGVDTALHCYLGTDRAGQMVREVLREEAGGIDSACAVERQNVTVSLALDGDRAMTTVGTDAVPPLAPLPHAPRGLVADLPTIQANLAQVRTWQEAEAPCTVFADARWGPSEQWDHSDLEPLEVVDVFTPNEGEALRYLRTDSVRQAAAALATRVPLAVITRGPRGVIAADGEQLLALPALDVPVVDTTGAGDAFAAGLTWALLEGADLRTALSAGQVTAAFTLTRPGGSLSAPRPADLRRMVEAYQVPEGYSLGFLDLAG